MTNFIPGGAVSTFVTTAISLGQSEKPNQDGVKANFIVFSLRSQIGGKPKRDIMFEDEIGTQNFLIFKKYLLMENGQAVKDAKGGHVVDLIALKQAPEFSEVEYLITRPGGRMYEYEFQKGACYANRIDGTPVTLKTGDPVIKTSIPIFVQVEFYEQLADGSMKPSYVPGFDPSRGERLERTFFRKAVNPTLQEQPAEQTVAPAEQGTPF